MVLLGAPPGPCSLLSARQRQIPFPAAALWASGLWGEAGVTAYEEHNKPSKHFMTSLLCGSQPSPATSGKRPTTTRAGRTVLVAEMTTANSRAALLLLAGPAAFALVRICQASAAACLPPSNASTAASGQLTSPNGDQHGAVSLWPPALKHYAGLHPLPCPQRVRLGPRVSPAVTSGSCLPALTVALLPQKGSIEMFENKNI